MIILESDPLYDNFYNGLSELQWAGHIPYQIPSFGDLLAMSSADQNQIGLRGGAGSSSELEESPSRDDPSREDYTWRLYGWQGQIKISYDGISFRKAVDCLLGFTTRRGNMVTLHRYSKATRRLDKSVTFETDTQSEADAAEFMEEEVDPDERKFAYFLTAPDEKPPRIDKLCPDNFG